MGTERRGRTPLRVTGLVEVIGVNPHLRLAHETLEPLFRDACRDRSPVPVSLSFAGRRFRQTLVRYAGAWRLYLNGPMLAGSGAAPGDRVTVELRFDPSDRGVDAPPALKRALARDPEARRVFDALSPSYRKELSRYIARLKRPESVRRALARALAHLKGTERFVGRPGLGGAKGPGGAG